MEQRPKYVEILEWIRKQIVDKELKPGERMYSENELMELFSVSRQTVRHAISKLEFEGIVERRRGSGTYIRERKTEIRHAKSMQIAVITTYIDEYIFPKIIQEIEQTVSKEGYTLQIASTHNSVEKERELLQKLIKEDAVDGIIIESTKSALPNPNILLYKKIIEREIPLVFLNSYYPQLKVPHVSLNDKMAGKLATQFLISKGHRKIGAIFKGDDGQGHLRYAGYIEALMEANLPIREQHIIWVSTEDVRRMQGESSRYIDRMDGNTAYVCYNDNVANELVQICLENSIRVPEELSIIGIDDSEVARRSKIPLTSVQNPVRSLGELSATVMLKMIQGIPVEKDYELMASIIERDSTCTCKRNKLVG